MNFSFHNLKYKQAVVVGLVRDIKANVMWTTIQSSSWLFIPLSFFLSSFAFSELEIVST